MRKKLWLWGGTLAGVALAATLGATKLARSADHLDAPATTADPTADINDVYSWIDGSNVVFALTAYPNAPAGTQFSDQVQYVIHTQSGASLGATTAEADIIAQFDTTGKISLWVGANEFVTGDASATTGLASADGKVKVFAGLRADPFFFNLDGFKKAAATVDQAEEAGDPELAPNDAGCPQILATTAACLRNYLSTDPNDAGVTCAGGPAQNNFAAFNALAIVVSVDKSLVNSGGAISAVWASTNSKP